VKYSCPACNGAIHINDDSTATVFVCPHCNFSGNINKLKEASQSGVGDVPVDKPSVQQMQEKTGRGNNNKALEPITRTTDMAKKPQPGQDQPPVPPPEGHQEEEATEGLLKEFEEGSIFSKVEEEEPIPETIPQPQPAQEVEEVQEEEPRVIQEGEIECPICRSVNNPETAVMESGTFKCFSCGSIFSPAGDTEPGSEAFSQPEDPILGQTIGGCRVASKVGEGGMGTVYKGIQISLDREVAIKILPGQYSRNRSFIRRFEREAKSLAKINHQNIMQIYDFGMHGDLYFMLMEFINGKSLSDMIEERYVLTLEELLPIIKQAAMGLECAQKNGVIHRDVKPDNIMIDEGRTVKMTDFGLAKIVGSGMSELTQEGVRVGTPAFMSPEQCKGEKALDIRTDIYSLGVTFYFALTGKLPFTGDSPFSIMLKHQNQQAEPVNKIVSGLPDAVSEIIEKMMKKEPEERYQTWEQFLDAVRAVERFMSVDLPDESADTEEDKLLKKDTLDIDVQKHSEDLPEGWGEDEHGGEELEEDAEKGRQVTELMKKGDSEFSGSKFEDAIATWQKALFLDPNNIELQDKISEGRHRIRQDNIEKILAEANVLEKKRKYRKALKQLDEVSKLKLSWQVKDMVSGSIARIQSKIRKRKVIFSIVRLIVLFVCLAGAVVIVYPNVMLLLAQRDYREAEKKERDALDLIEKDFETFEQRAREVVQVYSNVIKYKVPEKGFLGLVFERIGTENVYVDLAQSRSEDIERLIENTRIQHILTEAKEKLSALENEGKFIKAEEEADRILKEVGSRPRYYYLIEDIVKRVKQKSTEAKSLRSKALSRDVFEMSGEENIKKYSTYSEISAALKNYSELREKYPDTKAGIEAKRGFTVNTVPEGASVTVVTEQGMRITVRGRTTPLEIPVHRPNTLFTIILHKKGYKEFKKKYRKNTIDRKNETFELEYGPCWVQSTAEQKALTSYPLVYGKSLILLAHNKLVALDCETGSYIWEESNYLQKKSPLVSRFFNNTEDTVLYRGSIIVPCIDGSFTIIQTSRLKPGEWLSKRIDVRPAHRPTFPCVVVPKMLQNTTGLFFGGGDEAAMIGAVSLENGKPLWGSSSDATSGPAKNGGAEKEVLAKNIPGKKVQGDVLRTPVSSGSSIVFSTSAGYIYDIDVNTGTVKNHFQAGSAKGRNTINVNGQYVYYMESVNDRSMVKKLNTVTGKEEWQKEFAGNIYEGRPVIYSGKIIFGLFFSSKGRIIAVSEKDGSIVWTYPKQGDISRIAQEITVKDSRLFCASGTDILILNADKGKKLFGEYSTELANITEKLLVHNGYIYACTGDGKVYCFMIPVSLQSGK